MYFLSFVGNGQKEIISKTIDNLCSCLLLVLCEREYILKVHKKCAMYM